MHSKKRGDRPPAISDLGANSVLHTCQGLLALREADIGPSTFSGKCHLLRNSLEDMKGLQPVRGMYHHCWSALVMLQWAFLQPSHGWGFGVKLNAVNQMTLMLFYATWEDNSQAELGTEKFLHLCAFHRFSFNLFLRFDELWFDLWLS